MTMGGKVKKTRSRTKETVSEKDSASQKNSKNSSNVKNVQICCEMHFFHDNDCSKIRQNLLTWYDKNQRKLPWREIAKHEADCNIRGYSVWVSEVMLQQTQVATVIPYFNNWIKKWPSVQDLAAASLEEVLQVWAGLGYYSRGRRLHEGATIVVSQLGGKIPDTVEDLSKYIPGIGAYSASAIASVAFQKPVGVVDGNVIRVLSRMKALGAPVTQAGVRDHLWKLANKIVSEDRPGDFNQALMELGAVVCSPQTPSCDQCPVVEHCVAYSMSQKNAASSKIDAFLVNKLKSKKLKASHNSEHIGDIENIAGCQFCLPTAVWEKSPHVTSYPCKVEKKALRQEIVSVCIIECSGKFLMIRRPDKGLLAGLWEFPSIIVTENVSSKNKVEESNTMLEDLGLLSSLVAKKKNVGEVVHLFSHIHSTYTVDYIVSSQSDLQINTEREIMWMTEEEMKSAAISTAMKKVFALLRKGSVSSKSTGKKRKLSQEDMKQKSIKSFFS